MKLTRIKTLKTATPLATAAAGALALLALASFAQAKIHETYAQSVARYGEPALVEGTFARWNINNDFCVLATFDDSEGRCDTIRFLKWDAPYSEKDLQSIVKFNIPSNHWYREDITKRQYGARFWYSWAGRQEKKSALEESVLYLQITGDVTTGRDPYCISIWSKGAHQRATAAEKQQAPTLSNDAPVFTIIEKLDTPDLLHTTRIA